MTHRDKQLLGLPSWWSIIWTIIQILLVLLFSCQFFAASSGLAAHGDSQTSESFSKIRAAFFGIHSAEEGEKLFALLHTHGFNSALVNDSSYVLKLRLWKEWATMANSYGIRLFPVCNFAGMAEINALRDTFTPYVNRDGTVLASTPCPLDGEYWVRAIAERLSQFATLSTFAPLAGILFDTELYGSEISVYQDVCFCDLCWNEFLQMLVLSDRSLGRRHLEDARFLNASQRSDYLSRHDLQTHYVDFQEERLQKLLSRLEKHIHSIQPNIALGFLAYVDNWFYRALIRGLGTPGLPVFVFSETWYARGYTPLLLEEQTRILAVETESGSHTKGRPRVLYIPGLWQGRFFPEDLPQQVFNIAIHTDGYWIFSADSLWSEKHTTGHYALHGPREDYWTAFRTANSELEKLSTFSESSQSNLPPVHTASFYNSVQRTLQTQPIVGDLLRWLSTTQHPEDFHADVDFRDSALFHCLNVSAQGTLNIAPVPDNTQPFHASFPYKLFDAEGRLLQSANLQSAFKAVKIDGQTVPPEKFSLLIEAGINAARVSFEGIPCLLEASSTFPFTPSYLPQTYGVYVPEGKTRMKLRAYSPGENRTAVMTLQSTRNQMKETLDVAEFTEVHLPIKSHQHDIENIGHSAWDWTITIQPYIENPPDILFYFYDETAPYLFIRAPRTENLRSSSQTPQ